MSALRILVADDHEVVVVSPTRYVNEEGPHTNRRGTLSYYATID